MGACCPAHRVDEVACAQVAWEGPTFRMWTIRSMSCSFMRVPPTWHRMPTVTCTPSHDVAKLHPSLLPA